MPKRYPTIEEKRAWCRQGLDRASASGIEQVKLRVGQIGVGDCVEATSRNGKAVSLVSAELLPLNACDRPDQCGCRYQSWISLMDEIG